MLRTQVRSGRKYAGTCGRPWERTCAAVAGSRIRKVAKASFYLRCVPHGGAAYQINFNTVRYLHRTQRELWTLRMLAVAGSNSGLITAAGRPRLVARTLQTASLICTVKHRSPTETVKQFNDYISAYKQQPVCYHIRSNYCHTQTRSQQMYKTRPSVPNTWTKWHNLFPQHPF